MRSVARALDDLAEGVRSLLGDGESRPALVEELLGGDQRRTPPRRQRPPGRAAGGSRTPARHLARVK
jgi:hypothetical protein